MTFIRKIKKGNYTYLAKVENKRINGKVVQKHLGYIGRKLDGKIIKSGTIENTQITGVRIWGPLLILHTLSKEIGLSQILGKEGEYILSMVYAHCLDSKSVNKMEEWFSRTDLHTMLNIKEISEKKLYKALDSIDEKNLPSLQKKIFEAVKKQYKLETGGHFFDVTNTYFYGSECSLGKKGKSKEGLHKPQIQIGLTVTKEEGIPIFHKTFEGNIFDGRILSDMMEELKNTNLEEVFLIWDRGCTSDKNIIKAKSQGFEVICGLAIKGNLKKEIEHIVSKKDYLDLKNRVKLKESILYCKKKKFTYGKNEGNIVVCYNEKTARINKEKRIDKLVEAQELLKKGKPISDFVKKFIKNNKIDEKTLIETQKYDGYSVLFSTKDLPIEKIVKSYFEKDKVEKAFRSLKSSLGLRPIKHWLKKRVKAHVFICYISYLLISLLEYKLKKKKLSDISAISGLGKLETAYKVYMKNDKIKEEFSRIVTLTKEQEKIMNAVDKKLLKCSV
jgi:transposase